jgi:hypothetical protein
VEAVEIVGHQNRRDQSASTVPPQLVQVLGSAPGDRWTIVAGLGFAAPVVDILVVAAVAAVALAAAVEPIAPDGVAVAAVANSYREWDH